MQTRYRAAATALLLTATAGIAATGGAAQASGTHHTADRATKTLTITLNSKAHSVKVSDHKFRPGNTIFRVKNRAGKAGTGLMQVMRLKKGYDLNQAFNDIPAAFQGDTAAVKRVDRNIVFYGGIKGPKHKNGPARKWAVKIDKPGQYIAVNFHTQQLGFFTVSGAKQDRALPEQTGWINAVSTHHGRGNDFTAGKHNAASGWMSTKNKALEPHFVDISQVKKGTKDSDISAIFQGGPDPSVKHGGRASTGVISPGHRFFWAYHVPQGRYAALCFWPSLMNGQPHALMGMHAVFNLG